MKIFAIATTALLATASYAAPSDVQARNSAVEVTFIGAALGAFTQFFTTDNTLETIYNHLSVSKIHVPGGFTCTFYGVDGSVTSVVGDKTVDVGPPQTQVSGKCRPT